jgi:hypothetical protein
LRALRAIGILPVFAAGNFGPNPSTSVSPANYPESFAVGATDNNDQLYSGSSRGPSACGENQTIYPELVAPGVNITTTDLYGLYYAASGTSLAAPHAAAALALLLSAFPNLTADQQATALTSGATDLGAVGADNNFGSGRLNVLGGFNLLAGAAGNPTATPTPLPPTPTPTTMPTPEAPTPTPVPSLHIGDLDASTTSTKAGWSAQAAIAVHSGTHASVAGAKVTGSWSGGYTGSGSCTTDAAGRCQVATGSISKKSASTKFTVSGVTLAGYIYQSTSNHDPEVDSNGTAIMVGRP